MYRIPYDLVDQTFVLHDYASDPVEIPIKHLNELFGRCPICHCGEAFYIGEQRGDEPLFALQTKRVRLFSNSAYYGWGQMLLEALADLRCAAADIASDEQGGQCKTCGPGKRHFDRVNENEKKHAGTNRERNPGQRCRSSNQCTADWIE